MTEFLINTPNHKRWVLPSRDHYFNSFIYGNQIHQTICNRWTGETVLSLPAITIDEAGTWQDLCELAQELAKKKFPAKREAQIEAFKRSWKR